MKKITQILSIGAVALMGLSTSAFAKHNNACANDIQTLCGDAQGWKEIRACLNTAQSENKLSTACAEKRTKMKAKFEARKAAFEKACGNDVNTYCSNQKADAQKDGKWWEVRQCLKVNGNSISTACQTELAKKHRRHHHKKPTS